MKNKKKSQRKTFEGQHQDEDTKKKNFKECRVGVSGLWKKVVNKLAGFEIYIGI